MINKMTINDVMVAKSLKKTPLSFFRILTFATILTICGTAQAGFFSSSSPKPGDIQYSSWYEKDIKNFAKKEKKLNPDVLRLALQAYTGAKEKGIQINKPIITIIDYSLPSKENRMWVIDLMQKRVLLSGLVAHGKYSGNDAYANYFSNIDGSLTSSLGLYLTGNTYDGHNGYTLVMKGLEKGFNDNAEERRIVMHGAWYVSKEIAHERGYIGRSWGCPAVEQKKAVPLINTIKNGTLVFAYYPEPSWLQQSRYLNYRT